jgi:large repetitive protein
MNSDRFYFRRFFKKPAALKAPARKRLMETMEDRILYDAAPVVTIDASAGAPGIQAEATPLISEEFQFSTTFDNAGDADGYSPFTDIRLARGIDLTDSPKYLGASLQRVGGVDNSGNLTDTTYIHEYTGEVINVLAGEEYWVYALPFGSFVVDQPQAEIIFTAVTDKTEGALVGTSMDIEMRGGFRYGEDPLDNPGTDPLILGPTSSVTITPSVWSVTKDLLEHENETATGENFPNTWQLTIDVANGETINNVRLRDVLPDNVDYVSGSLTISSGAFSIQLEPDDANYAGGILDLTISQITGVVGTDVTITYQTYTPQFQGTGDVNGNDVKDPGDYEASATPVIDPSTGAAVTSPNGVDATADYDPDGAGLLPVVVIEDVAGGPNDNVDSPNTDTLIDRSLAIQKGVSGGGTVLPGDELTYDLDFQVSDYFQFQNLVIVDRLGDGQLFDPTDAPTLTWDAGGVTFNGVFTVSGAPDVDNNVGGLTVTDYGHFVVIHNATTGNLTSNLTNPGVDTRADGIEVQGGETVILFFLSDQMIAMGGAPLLVGGRVNGATNGGTQGTITYKSNVQEAYINPMPGNPSIDLDDPVTSSVTISGEVVEWDNVTVGSTVTDGSGTQVVVPSPALDKQVYAVNGVVGAPAALTPGDSMSYVLTLDLPTSDVENLVVTDFLPLPKFDATELTFVRTVSETQFATLGVNYVPPAGMIVLVFADEVYEAKFGAGSDAQAIDGGTLLPADGGLAASVGAYNTSVYTTGGGGVSASANSFSLNIGSYDVDNSVGAEVAIYFTVTASDTPMADGLLLTNQLQASYGNTGGTALIGQDIVQVIVQEPVVNIYKGVVASTQGAGTTATDGVDSVTFNDVGSNGFGGTLETQELAEAIGELDLDTGTLPDAGDVVRFAIVVQNTGRADAFDVTFTDTIPDSYDNDHADAPAFAAATNFQVYNGAGTLLTVGVDYTLAWNNATNTFTVQLTDAAGGTLGAGKTTDGDPIAGGLNSIVVLYDLTLLTTAQASSTVTNTATLTNYAGTEGGTDHTAEDREESASVVLAAPTITKAVTNTGIDNLDTGDTDDGVAVIGELVEYTLTLTVGEGTTIEAQITDLINSGMAFVGFTGLTVSAGLTTGVGGTGLALTDASGFAALNAAIGSSIVVSNNGQQFTIDLGTITNADNNNGTPQTVTLTYNAVVLNIAGNDRNDTLANGTVSLDWEWTDDTVLAADGSDTLTVTDSNAADDIRIEEPTLTISNALSDDGIAWIDGGTLIASAGQTVYYQVVIENTSDVTAYNLSVYDALPNVFSIPDTSVTSIVITHADLTTTTIDPGDIADYFGIITDDLFLPTNDRPALITTGTLLNLAAGDTLTLVVESTIKENAVSNSNHPNGIQVRWTSLDDGVRSEHTTDTNWVSTDYPDSVAAMGAYTPVVLSTYNTSATERTGAGGPGGPGSAFDDYGAEDAVGTFLEIQSSDIVKELIGTQIDDSLGANTNAANEAVIGEYVEYRITFTVPKGATYSVELQDVLQEGLVFVEFLSITVGENLVTHVDVNNDPTAGSLSFNDPANLALLSDPGMSGISNDGRTLTISFGDIFNSVDNPAGEFIPAQEIVITYRALVTNIGANQSTETRNNTATLTYETVTDSEGTRATRTEDDTSDNVILIEPDLDVVKTVTTAGPYDAGDTVEYEITIDHTGSSDTHAYDLGFTHGIPAKLLAFTSGVAFTDADIGTTGSGKDIIITHSSGADISALFEIVGGELRTKAGADIDLLDAEDITITIKGVLAAAVEPSEIINGDATVTWTSLDGDVAFPSDHTTDDTERDGSGEVNNYTRTDDADLLTIASPTVDKQWKDGALSADDTSVGSSTGSNVVIGEQVTYDLLVTLPNGTVENFNVNDFLPPGLRMDGYEIITLDAAAGLLTADFDGDLGAAYTLNAYQAVTLAAGADFTWDFGTVTTAPGASTAGANQFVIRVSATVVNIAANQQGNTLALGGATLTHDNPNAAGTITVNDASGANNPSVTIVEPTLTVTKGSVLPAGAPLDAGDVIDYTITLSNASGQTAYDVTLSDAIDANLDVTTGIIPGGALTISGGANVSADAFEIVLDGGTYYLRTAPGANIDIPDGESVVITFSATVAADVPPSAQIENIANARWTSTDGLNADERGGDDIDDDAPTTLDQATAGADLNDYALSSGVVDDAINNITIVKSVVTSSLGGDTDEATPGEIVTYRITVTLPEGEVPDLRIRDAIPPGMAYIAGSLVLVDGAFAGSVTAPGVSPTSGPTYLNGQDVEFNFDAISVDDDNDAGNNTFSFTYQVVVLDVVGNINGHDLDNTATHNNGTGAIFAGGSSATIEVVVPALQVVQTVSVNGSAPAATGTGDAGDPVDYSVVISHTPGSGSPAFDLGFSQDLPAQIGDSLAGALTMAGITITHSDGTSGPGADGNITDWFEIVAGELRVKAANAQDIDLAIGQTITIAVTGVLRQSINPGTEFTNDATVTYTTLDGDFSTAAPYNPNADVTTDHERVLTAGGNTVTVEVPAAVTLVKTVVTTSHTGAGATDNNDLAIGETITLRLETTLNEGTTLKLTLTDTIAAGLRYETGTAIFRSAAGVTAVGLVSGLTYEDGDIIDADDITDTTSDTVAGALVFNFATVITPGSSGATTDAFQVDYTLRAVNVAANQGELSPSKLTSATASADLDGDGDHDLPGETTAADTETITIVEPTLEIETEITSDTTNLDAGDTVTYAVTISHSAGSTATAFELVVDGGFPAQLRNYTIVSAQIDGIDVPPGSFAIDSDTGVLTTTGDLDLQLGQELVIVLSGIVQDDTVVGTELEADATVVWSSLQGGLAGDDDGTSDERTGAGDPENDYIDTAALAVTTRGALSVDKSADRPTATIGEVVTYTLEITVAEGRTVIDLMDTLPAGLTFVAGSMQIDENADGLTITGLLANSLTQTITVTSNGGTANDGSVAHNATFTLTYQAVVNTTNAAGDPDLDNEVIVSSDLDNDPLTDDDEDTSDASVEIVEPALEITKAVNPASTGSDAGDDIEYTITIGHTGASTADAFDLTFTDLLPPQVVKAVVDGGADTPLDMTNIVVERLDAGNVVNGTFTGQFEIVGGVLRTIAGANIDLADGETLRITVTGVLSDTITPFQVIANTAAVTWSSLDDATPASIPAVIVTQGDATTPEVQSFTPPAAGDYVLTFGGDSVTIPDGTAAEDIEDLLNALDSIDTAGGVSVTENAGVLTITFNDAGDRQPIIVTPTGITERTYSADDAVAFTTDDALAITKDADRTTATIGEEITYTLVITVNEGITHGVQIVDTLPTNIGGDLLLEFVPGSASISYGTAGTTISGSVAPSVVDDTLTFALGTVVLPAAGTADTITITYRVRVTDVADNDGLPLAVDGDGQSALDNSATVTADDIVTVPGHTDEADDVTVTEPHLTVTKDADDADNIITPGSTVTYTIDVANTGTASAHNVVITDSIDAGILSSLAGITVELVDLSDSSTVLLVAGAGDDYTVTSGVTGLTVTLNDPLAVGFAIRVTYDATYASDLAAGTPIDNNARVTFSSLTADGRNYTPDLADEVHNATTDPRQDTERVTVGTGSVSNLVWFDIDGDGIKDAAEKGIAGVTVWIDIDGSGDFDEDLDLFAITDEDGLYTITGLAPGTYTVRVDLDTLPVNDAGLEITYDLDDLLVAPDATATVTIAADGDDLTDVDFGFRGTATLGDFVWLDLDGDGTLSGNEPGIEGVVLNLIWDADFNGIDGADTVIATTTTAADGSYSFAGLLAGNYRVVIAAANFAAAGVLEDATATYDLDGTDVAPAGTATVTLATNTAASDLDTLDFGYQGAASIGDRVWNDLDGDGIADAGEFGVSGVTLQLEQFIGGAYVVIATTTTAANGAYSFDGLLADDYRITVLAANFAAAGVLEDTTATYDLDGTGTAHVAERSVTASGSATDVDFGYQGEASISGNIWFDQDASGITADGGEPPLANVRVTITVDGVTRETFTDINGDYVFDGLIAGTYTVVVDETTLPAGLRKPTWDRDDNTPADADGQAVITVTSSGAGATVTNANFGYQGENLISGYSYHDTDRDGSVDVGETGIGGVTIELIWDDNGNGLFDAGTDYIVTSVITGADGYYEFTDLIIGDYIIRETQPSGFGSSTANMIAFEVEVATDYENQNFGNTTGTLSGVVFRDDNNNGAQNGAEDGLAGVTVYLDMFDADLGAYVQIGTATTNATGGYTFDHTNTDFSALVAANPGFNFGDTFAGLLATGTYRVRADQPEISAGVPYLDGKDTAGTAATAAGTVQGDYDGSDGSDAISGIQLTAGQDATGYTFAELTPASLSGFVYIDLDNDGVKDAFESGLPGVTVTLTGTDDQGTAIDIDVVTDATGAYTFENLRPGSYTITQTPHASDSYLDGTDTVGTGLAGATPGNDEGILGVNTITGITFNNVAPGNENGTDYNFGVQFDPAATKSIVTTSLDNDDSDSVVIGETVTYSIVFDVPSGDIDDVIVRDLIPDGLRYINGSATVSYSAGITPAVVAGVLPGAAVSNNTTTDDDTYVSGTDVYFRLGDLTNATAGGAPGRVTITFQAVVVNDTVVNTNNATHDNTVEVSWDRDGDGDGTDAGDLAGTSNTVTTTVAEPVLTVTKTVEDLDVDADNTDTPHLGGDIRYTIEVTHAGTSTADAYDLVLTDVIPADKLASLTNLVVSLNGVALTAGTDYMIVTAPTTTGWALSLARLDQGDTITITYDATISSDPADVLGADGLFGGGDDFFINTATLDWSSLPDGHADEAGERDYTEDATETVTVEGAGLRIDKDDGLVSVQAGDSWTYTLTITNVGTDTATGVTLVDTLPPQVTVNAIRVGGAPVAFTVDADGKVTLDLPDIPDAGAGVNVLTVEFDVTLDAVIDVERESLTNTATVTHDDIDPTPDDNTDDDIDVIVASPDMGVVKQVASVNGSPAPVNGLGQPIIAAGDDVIYTIVVTNTGTQNAVVTIVDTFPGLVLDLANISIDDADTGVVPVIDTAAGTITWTGVSLDVGQTITITIEARAFDPQLHGIDDFANSVVVGNTNTVNPADDALEVDDTVVAELDAAPDLVVTKVNSTDRIDLLNDFTYTITLTNAGTQNATGVTIVDTLPPHVEFLSATGNFIWDPVARTITWTAADNPELAVLEGGGNETIVFTVTVKLPINSIAFGELTNNVRVFDDGTNGADANPDDNAAFDTTEVLGFLYDSLRNFSLFGDGEEDHNDYELGLPIKVYHDAILPIAPIYSGAAEPGSTLEVALYNADGEVIGRQTVVVDTGGNWMASFPGTIMKDYPQSVVITQTPASAAPDQDSSGYNLRPYYATAINAGHFFRENLNVSRVSEQTSERITDDLQDALNNPIGFEINSTAYESLASPGQPSGR